METLVIEVNTAPEQYIFVVMSLTATTEDRFWVGDVLQFFVQFREPGEEWADAGTDISNTPLAYVLANPLNSSLISSGNFVLPKNSRSFDVRFRAQIVHDIVSPPSFTEWSNVASYVVDESPTLPSSSIARTVTYKSVRDGVINRYFSSTPNASEMQRIAAFITAANRRAHQGYAWSERIITEEIDCDDGKVLWADVQGADHRTFYTDDPRPPGSTAVQILEKTADTDGIWLTSLAQGRSTVWASYVPRLPEFSTTAIESDTTYDLGFVGYHETTGHCYECIASAGALGSTVDDATRWRPLPILWIVKNVIEALAEAAFLCRSQERGQAAVVTGEAMADLSELQFHDCKKQHTLMKVFNP